MRGDIVTALLTLLLIGPQALAEDAETDDEFGFLEEGERNRAKVEADRAPNASIFLEEEDDASPMWEAGDSGEPFNTIDDDLAEDDDLDADLDMNLDPMDSDPIEDMVGLGPDMRGMTPLGDHFDLSVARSPLGPLVVELPVLVARTPSDLVGDLWIVADFYVDGRKTGEARHFFTPDSASEMGATYAWLKTTVPVSSPSGLAEIRVFSAPPGKKESLLFVRKAVFTN